MKTKRRTLLVIGGDDPKFACTGCTASCRRPFGTPLDPESAHQILTSEKLRPLLTRRAARVMATGWLPMRDEEGSGARCLFLTEEGSCAVLGELGPKALPRACHEYPLLKIRDERGDERLSMRRGCPGVGGAEASDRLALSLEPRTLASRLGLSSGKTLVPSEYGQMIAVVEELLSHGDPRSGLRSAFRYSEAVSAALESGAEVRAALALVPPSREPDSKGGSSVFGRMLLRITLGSFAEFGDVPFRATELGAWGRVVSLARALGWALGAGRARVFGGRKVSRRKISRVRGLFEGGSLDAVRSYLGEVLARRQLFLRQTYFSKALVELGLLLAVLGLVARARALARGGSDESSEDSRVSAQDVMEGIVVAESFLDAQLAGQSLPALEHLRGSLLADELAFSSFLDSV